VHADNTRQAGSETRASNIAGPNDIHSTRQLGGQGAKPLLAQLSLRDMSGSMNSAIINNAPLQPGIANIEQ
jgi:hypothetical protein